MTEFRRKSSPRRVNRFVDFEVQTSLLRKVAVHWVLFIIANSMALFFWIRLVESPFASWNECFAEFTGHYIPVLLISCALIPVFLLDTIKLSNRFTGPVLRLRHVLHSMANGEAPKPLKFRKNDFWQSLAVDFNKALNLGTPPQRPERDSPPVTSPVLSKPAGYPEV